MSLLDVTVRTGTRSVSVGGFGGSSPYLLEVCVVCGLPLSRCVCGVIDD